MAIRLVSYSKPSDEFLEEGLENCQDLIAFCAKVSNPTAQINTATSAMSMSSIKPIFRNSIYARFFANVVILMHSIASFTSCTLKMDAPFCNAIVLVMLVPFSELLGFVSSKL